MIGAADHECGGLVAGGQFDGSPEYGWVPEALEPAQHSSSYLGGLIAKYKGDDLHDYVENTIFPLYGINDANSTEVAVAVANNASSYFNDIHIAQSLSRRAMVKWTTLGHSAVDVNLIGYPADRVENIRGNHENVELGQFMIDTMGLDVDVITQKYVFFPSPSPSFALNKTDLACSPSGSTTPPTTHGSPSTSVRPRSLTVSESEEPSPDEPTTTVKTLPPSPTSTSSPNRSLVSLVFVYLLTAFP